jgi:hypothetical protein
MVDYCKEKPLCFLSGTDLHDNSSNRFLAGGRFKSCCDFELFHRTYNTPNKRNRQKIFFLKIFYAAQTE